MKFCLTLLLLVTADPMWLVPKFYPVRLKVWNRKSVSNSFLVSVDGNNTVLYSGFWAKGKSRESKQTKNPRF